ncbi:DUF4304 domain-containing protein [Mucilaginibacter sp. CAU 1740]|uniref:DUF4304 domain-containing protein n=1 Tax=Mucilaginibacter sp. CAU 1740 TaxID=3140365 RepID=UPI00325AF74A
MPAEEKFNIVLEDGFAELLKPRGFENKGNNFYLKLNGLGHLINVQKSAWGTREHNKFTINIGIFVPKVWLAFFNFSHKEVPDFPRDVDCLIRKRIGTLKNKSDNWYRLSKETPESDLLNQVHSDIQNYILPYLSNFDTIEKLLTNLEQEEMPLFPMGKMVTYSEFNLFEHAKHEYQQLLREYTDDGFQNKVKEFGKKYKLDR